MPNDPSNTVSFGMLTSFPPTPCGIATFGAALSAALVAHGHTVDVVRVGSGPALEDPMVQTELDTGTGGGLAAAVAVLDATDVVIVQHEYGLYDGTDGSDVVAVMEALAVPTVVVAHTVRHTPTPGQLRVLRAVCAAASAVVVMTESARATLVDVFDVDEAKVRVIAHGAAIPPTEEHRRHGPRRVPTLLTWGLLGPGKGIEWAIDALATLTDLQPRPRYVIAGATHPKVRERAGEAYRDMLMQRAWSTGAIRDVTFDDSYRSLPELAALIASADLVVLPYDSVDQVTSGVLVDAVAAGRPVVATAFPHAVELLGSGAGIVVPQGDPAALADAIRRVLVHPQLAADMAAEARRLAPALSWSSVAAEYADLAGDLAPAAASGPSA